MDLNWYNTLNKPAFTPPANVFAPAWTILYLLMFLSLYIFIRSGSGKERILGVVLFSVQLLLNLLWSPAFFVWNNIGLSFFIIILLLIFLVMTIVNFYNVSKLSAVLLIPYLLWTLFATYLNYGFMVLN